MVDKDHLFTHDEYVREINRKNKILNSQQFAVTGPAGLGPYLVGTGLTANVEPIQERFEGRGNPIKDFGVVGLQTVNIDFDDLGTQYNIFQVNDDITFAFNNFPLDQAMPFVFDIELTTANPTITYPPSVKNLPTNLPTASGSRYDLLFWGVKNATEERFYIIGGEGTATIPLGTVENEHLEWDNTGLKWDAVTSSTYGATGPFADTGFLRFANDQIMLSQRNFGNNGNLELKVTNDAVSRFDFTESAENEITVQLRAQHATEADQKFIFKQFSGTGAASQVDFPNALNIVRGADLLISLPDASNIDFFEASDAFGFNLAGAGVVNMGALNALVFNQFATIGKSISRFATGLHYDLENSAHTHLFRVNGATPANAFEINDTEVKTYKDVNVNSFDLKSVDRIEFVTDSGGPTTPTTPTIFLDATGDMTFNIATDDSFFWSEENITRMALNVAAGNDTELIVQSDSVTASTAIVDIRRNQTGLVAPHLIGTLRFTSYDSNNSSLFEYGFISGDVEDRTSTSKDGQVTIGVIENNSATDYMRFNDGSSATIDVLKEMDMNNNNISWSTTGFAHNITVTTTSLSINTGVDTDTLFLQTGGGTRILLTSTGSTFFGDLDANTNDIVNMGGGTIFGLTTVTAVAGDFVMIRDATDSALKKVDANDFLGAASQTPWTSEIDADGNNLVDFARLELRNPGSFVAAGVAGFGYDGTTWRHNVPTGDIFDFTIQGAFAFSIEPFGIDLGTGGEIQFGTSTRFIDFDSVDGGLRIEHLASEQFNLTFAGALEYDFNETEFDLHANNMARMGTEIKFNSASSAIVWPIGTAPNETQIFAGTSNMRFKTGSAGDEFLFTQVTTDLLELNSVEMRIIDSDLEMDLDQEIRWNAVVGGAPRIIGITGGDLEYEVAVVDRHRFRVGASNFEVRMTEPLFELFGNFTSGMEMRIFRDDATPLDNDIIGFLSFDGRDSVNARTTYAEIIATILDVTNGTEDGRLELRVASGGGFVTGLVIDGADTSTIPKIGFRGAVAQAVQNYTVTNPTTNRSLDVSGATSDQLRQVVGTILQDFIDNGMFQ